MGVGVVFPEVHEEVAATVEDAFVEHKSAVWLQGSTLPADEDETDGVVGLPRVSFRR